jgi:DNA helicase II / ATP-dependent DNA helicase PcrA
MNLKEQFLEELKTLNERQSQAVKTTEGPVMVIAGPGTGKTQILAARIGYILQNIGGTQPHNILCLTFTEAGVVAMKQRLSRFIGADAHRVQVYTFHGFCNKVIQDHPEYFGRYDMQPLSDLDNVKILDEIVKNLPQDHLLFRWSTNFGYDRKYLGDFFKLMKSENWSPEDIKAASERMLEEFKDNPQNYYSRKSGKYNKGDLKEADFEKLKEKLSKTIASADLLPVYEKLKSEEALYDYTDMIQWVIKAFENNDELLAHYQEQFLYVLVDEFQDTNGSQKKILDLLMEYWEEPNLFVVGDDDQSIYRFQGANIKNLNDLYEKYFAQKSKKYNQERIIFLNENYRSTQPILDTSKTLIDLNLERIVQSLNFDISKELTASHPARQNPLSNPEIREYQTLADEEIVKNQIIQTYKGIQEFNFDGCEEENCDWCNFQINLQKSVENYTSNSAIV